MKLKLRWILISCVAMHGRFLAACVGVHNSPIAMHYCVHQVQVVRCCALLLFLLATMWWPCTGARPSSWSSVVTHDHCYVPQQHTRPRLCVVAHSCPKLAMTMHNCAQPLPRLCALACSHCGGRALACVTLAK